MTIKFKVSNVNEHNIDCPLSIFYMSLQCGQNILKSKCRLYPESKVDFFYVFRS